MAGIEASIVEIESSRWSLITSAIAFAEVLESKSGAENVKKFRELFKRPNIASINTDMRIGELAGELKDYYFKRGEKRKLTTPDALHLATAILYDAEEFHTFDDGKNNRKSLGLLGLNGNVGGHRLIVVPPGTKQRRLDFKIQEDIQDAKSDSGELPSGPAPPSEAPEK